MGICSLCLNERPLAESHVIPSFVVKWLKDTSVTGFVRDARHGNRRIQDGYKTPLLCFECEAKISKVENSFNLRIFKVFTEEYLDLAGRIKADGYLEYDEWLNRFIISVVWRSFKADMFIRYPEDASVALRHRMAHLMEKWRVYLLGDSENYGKVTNYVLLLRNIHEGTGELPDDISPKIIHYLMRTIDGALIMGDDLSVAMTKMGPIMTLTAIHPSTLPGYPNSRIGRNGKLKIEQVWSNGKLNHYLFVQRPNELQQLPGKSDSQWAQINKSLKKNQDRVETTMTFPVVKSDSEKKA